MNLLRVFRFSMRVFLLVPFVVALSATTLLERMRPAADQILGDHGQALKLNEAILSQMAKWDTAPYDRDEIDIWVRQMKSLSQGEIRKSALAVIDRLNTSFLDDKANSAGMRRTIIFELNRLSELHREAMWKANRGLIFLSTAGSWAVVGIAGFGILIGWLIIERTQRRILKPLADMTQGLLDWQRGNRMRRFRFPEATSDIQQTSQLVNDLLDQSLSMGSGSRQRTIF